MSNTAVAVAKCPARKRCHPVRLTMTHRQTQEKVPAHMVRNLANIGENFFCISPYTYAPSFISEEVKRRIGTDVSLVFDSPPKVNGNYYVLRVDPPSPRRPRHAALMQFLEVSIQ